MTEYVFIKYIYFVYFVSSQGLARLLFYNKTYPSGMFTNWSSLRAYLIYSIIPFDWVAATVQLSVILDAYSFRE